MKEEKQKFRKIKFRSFTQLILLNKIFIYKMIYKIIRIDGKDDELTAQSFNKYSDAYDLLEEIYGDLCCSDADYGDIIYYDIVENNFKNINGE